MSRTDPRTRHRPLTVSQIGSRGIPGHRGGVERVIEAVAPRLAAKGCDVTVYCADWTEHRSDNWKGVKLRYVASTKHKYFDTIGRSIVATMREIFGGSQIVHFHSSGSAPLALLARLTGKKTVVTIHGLDWQRRKWNMWGRLALRFGEWAAVRFPHRTVVVGPDLKTWLDSRYDADITYIPNGVEERRQVRPGKIQGLGLDRRKFVLFLARLTPEKQVHTLIDAWMELEDKKGMTLAVAGPSWHSKDYAESLRRQAANDPSVQFMGEVDEQTLEELYSNCYAYVLPSEVEGMSLSLLDAMAFGACVVCSDIAPNVAVVGKAGVTFKVGDAADLRKRLAQVMSDPERAERLRTAARQRISEEFTWDKVADRWEKLYNEVAVG